MSAVSIVSLSTARNVSTLNVRISLRKKGHEMVGGFFKKIKIMMRILKKEKLTPVEER